jgi:hypothetical protein
VYQDLTTSANLSGFAAAINGQMTAVRSMERGTTTPGVVFAGLLWCKSDYAYTGGAGDAVMRHDGSAFVFWADARYAQLNAGGTVALAADLSAGGHKITNLAAATSAADAVRKDQVAAIAGTWTADVDAAGNELKNLGPPVADDQSAARFDDTWQTTHGVLRRLTSVAVDDGSLRLNQLNGGKNPGAVGLGTFCPAVLHLVLEGNVTRTAGGAAVIDGLPRTVITCLRDGDEGTSYVGYGTVSGSHAGTPASVDVEVRWKTDAPRGFYLRLRRQSDSATCQIGKCVATAMAGVGFVS